MTFYPQCRFTRSQDRLHSRMDNLLTINDAIVIATHYLLYGHARYGRNEQRATYGCERLDIDVNLPVFGPLRSALERTRPDEIRIDFLPQEPPPLSLGPWAGGLGRGKRRHVYSGLVRLIWNLISPIFVEFYEVYFQTVRDKHGPSREWPIAWRFARIVRNALSHGNCVFIRDPKEQPVAWNGLTYSHADKGRYLFADRNPDLMPGDLIVLMFEMDDFLMETTLNGAV